VISVYSLSFFLSSGSVVTAHAQSRDLFHALLIYPLVLVRINNDDDDDDDDCHHGQQQ